VREVTVDTHISAPREEVFDFLVDLAGRPAYTDHYLEDYRLALRPGFTAGQVLYLLGETRAELGGSEYAEAVLGKVAGRPPGLDLEAERRLIGLLVEAAGRDLAAAAHDCSDGGVGIALAECGILGDTGFAVALPLDLPDHVALFSESASRAVVAVEPADAKAFEELCAEYEVSVAGLGETGGPRMVFGDVFEIPVAEARAVFESALPNLLGHHREAG
jgi:phosphoribosylformylglycinamidine synthase subunit PurL